MALRSAMDRASRPLCSLRGAIWRRWSGRDFGELIKMILKMYELAAADMERLAGWPAEAGHYAGAIRAPWPPDRMAIELAVSSADARGKSLSAQERRATVRRLIPWLARRLMTPEDANGMALVLRIDGRLQPGGLLEVFRRIDPTHTSLFQFSGGARLSAAEPLPAASVSMLASTDVLADMAQDSALALQGGVRLRALAVAAEVVPMVLSCQSVEDERWSSILPQVNLFISPSASLQSVFVIGPASAEELRHRLVNGATAQAQP